jgi:hypothetical protein
MLLNQIAGKSNPPAKNSETAEFSERIQRNFEISDCRYERELAVGMSSLRTWQEQTIIKTAGPYTK